VLSHLLYGTLIISVIVIFHIAALIMLAVFIKKLDITYPQFRTNLGHFYLLLISVFVIIGIHTIEAWAWAYVYMYLGEFADFEQALYFSVVTSTTLGYGDITLSPEWQLLSTFEAMGGLLLFGVSTAFLIAVTRNLFEKIARGIR
jgi:hypothetical protein